jgi:signal transduction histidine kinase
MPHRGRPLPARLVSLRPRLLGLRPRLLGALLLTSVVTLAVAALALLSPLEQRLRGDGEETVKTAIGASRLEFAEIPLDAETGRLDAAELRRAANALRRRADATVAVLNDRLEAVYPGSTVSLNVPDYYGQVRRALRTHRPVHTLVGDLLVVAEPIEISGERYVVALTKRLDYVSSAVRVVQIAFLEAAAAGVLIAMLLGVGLTTRLLRRLEQLRDATRELERHGPQGAPLPEDPSPDEIGELARAFARMQAQLRGQEAARRAFVATASHELRTPLASLDGVLELLEDDLDPSHLDLEDARVRTARAREQAHTLSQLATDLLDLSRLDAEVELRSEPVELGELCRAVAAELTLVASRRGVALALTLAETEPCWAQGDPGAVARIVRILLDNALRVAPPGSSIEVRTAAEDGAALLSVYDQGPGVVAAERELIFNRFQRGSATGGRGGFGLGLAIGRELATRMGGSLELLDRRAGACFQLRLPLAPEEGTPGLADRPGRAGVPS